MLGVSCAAILRAGGTLALRLPRGRGAIARRAHFPQRLSVGPVWFDHMDRNGDGNRSPREFLGTPERFEKMDADHDGLIDPKAPQPRGRDDSRSQKSSGWYAPT